MPRKKVRNVWGVQLLVVRVCNAWQTLYSQYLEGAEMPRRMVWNEVDAD